MECRNGRGVNPGQKDSNPAKCRVAEMKIREDDQRRRRKAARPPRPTSANAPGAGMTADEVKEDVAVKAVGLPTWLAKPKEKASLESVAPPRIGPEKVTLLAVKSEAAKMAVFREPLPKVIVNSGLFRESKKLTEPPPVL